MAYSRKGLGGNIGAGSNAPKLFTYKDAASTKAAIDTDDYFLDLFGVLAVGDGVYCLGSDGAVLLSVVLSSATTVTTEEATLA